jgi:hypothetical protein
MFVFGNISSVGAVIPPRPLSAGIELVSELTGAGDRDRAAAGQGSPRTFATSFAR